MAVVLAKGFVLICFMAGLSFSQEPPWIEMPGGLKYRILKEGTGPQAKVGQHASIHESTYKLDGTLVYSSKKGSPIKFLIGGKQVIDGVDQGVRGMRVGEHRQLWVPSSLAKRTAYPDAIDPDDDLKYDVELVALE